MLFLLLNIDCGNRLDKADLNVHTKSMSKDKQCDYSLELPQETVLKSIPNTF